MRTSGGSDQLPDDGAPSRDGTADGELCALRLERDVAQMPPGSNELAEFERQFEEDIARTVGGSLTAEQVRVHSVVADAGEPDWLTVVAFELVPVLPVVPIDPAVARNARVAQRRDALERLEAAIADHASRLYHGRATRDADASFAPRLRGYARMTKAASAAASESDALDVKGVSPDARVQGILEKYQALPAPPAGSLDVTHFTVRVTHDGGPERLLRVLNPKFVRKRSCFVWPIDTKRALGYIGTVQDVWLQPTGLVPTDVPREHATPIRFAPNKACGGMPVISASLLKPGRKYEVTFTDRRQAALDALDPEMLHTIEDTFESFDTNHDGSISREEVMAGCAKRTAKTKAAIDAQYAAAVEAANGDVVTLAQAQAAKAAHYKRLHDSEAQLLAMFASSDINGDGTLDKLEFMLAEAYWMSSTMNPAKISLF